jgi:hypothetical protein
VSVGRRTDSGVDRNSVEAKKTFQMRKKSGENPLTEIGLTSILGDRAARGKKKTRRMDGLIMKQQFHISDRDREVR